MRRPKVATLMTVRKPMWHHTKTKRFIQEIKNRHFTNWWPLSHFPWTTAFTRTFATSILWRYNFNGMIKWYDISCATLYYPQRIGSVEIQFILLMLESEAHWSVVLCKFLFINRWLCIFTFPSYFASPVLKTAINKVSIHNFYMCDLFSVMQ